MIRSDFKTECYSCHIILQGNVQEGTKGRKEDKETEDVDIKSGGRVVVEGFAEACSFPGGFLSRRSYDAPQCSSNSNGAAKRVNHCPLGHANRGSILDRDRPLTPNRLTLNPLL